MKIKPSRHPYSFMSRMNWAGTWFLSTIHLGVYIALVIIAIILIQLFKAIVSNLYWGKGFKKFKKAAAAKQGWCALEWVGWMHFIEIDGPSLFCTCPCVPFGHVYASANRPCNQTYSLPESGPKTSV